MKNLKKVLCALLSIVMASSMTSCLDSGDSTVYLSGTGTTTSSSTIRLDNGLVLSTSSLSLTMGNRVYIYAGASEDDYNTAVNSINNGGKGTVTLTSIITAGECEYVYAEDATDDLDSALENIICTPINSISWLNFGAFGNGYMQFVINTDYYLKKGSDSSYSLVTPDIHCFIQEASASNVVLVLAMNNRKASCTDESGNVLSGYEAYTGGDIPVSVNISDLYYTMTGLGLSDSDYLNLTVKYVDSADYNINESSTLTGKLGTSTNYFYVGSLKNLY